MKDPEISPSRHSHLILDKGTKSIHWKKEPLISGSGKTGESHVENQNQLKIEQRP
jgi:hypothetical protein